MDTDRGIIGRVVASDIREPGFESSHRELFLSNINFTVYGILKTKINTSLDEKMIESPHTIHQSLNNKMR